MSESTGEKIDFSAEGGVTLILMYLLWMPHTKGGGLILVSREKVLLKIRGGCGAKDCSRVFFRRKSTFLKKGKMNAHSNLHVSRSSIFKKGMG